MSRTRSFITRVVFWGAITVVISGCSSSSSGDTDRSSKKIRLNVSASASLARAFDEIYTVFELQFPAISVSSTFAGSATLVTQIQNGATADVVALADTTNMEKLREVGQINPATVKIFATNTMTIAVPRKNPNKVAGLRDLADESINVVLCAPNQPCGAYARQILENAGLSVSPKSLETSVGGVISKISNGQADAGIVYVTDILAAAKTVEAVSIPAALNITALYPIARRAELSTTVQKAADTFIAFVLGKSGTEILNKYGFRLP